MIIIIIVIIIIVHEVARIMVKKYELNYVHSLLLELSLIFLYRLVIIYRKF